MSGIKKKILNEMSYFGAGSRSVLANEIKNGISNKKNQKKITQLKKRFSILEKFAK